MSLPDKERRTAWAEICMVEYRICGDMMKAASCADRLIKTIETEARHAAAEKIRTSADEDTAYRPKYQDGMRAAADLIDPGMDQ